MAKNATERIRDNLLKLMAALDKIVSMETLVGVPQETTQRSDGGEMNNATLAYIHDNGAPEANIPARPFMRPGIRNVQDKIQAEMKAAATLRDNDAVDVERRMMRAGQIAVSSIKNVITSGIDPALKPSTILNRYRSRKTKGMRKGEKNYASLIGGGMSPEQAQAEAGITPLINTAGMLNAITFVVRKK